MKTLFNRTVKWNNMMGNITPDKFTIPKNKELLRDLMIEEARELFDATTKDDALDAVADQMFVLFGNMAQYGLTWFEVKAYLNRVVKSNESKFANTEQEALDSIIKEAKRLDISEDSISYLLQDGKYIIFNGDTGKILKSINYVEPSEIE